MEDQKYCLIQFKCSYKTIPGEELRIVGNIPELGNWDINKSEKMVTSKLEFPVWKTKENIKVKQNSEIEYKYLLFKDKKFLKWENVPNNSNRTILIKNLVRMIIHDQQDSNIGNVEKFTKLASRDETDIILNENYEEIENKFDFRSPKINKLLHFERHYEIKPSELFSKVTSEFSNEYTDLDYTTEEETEEIHKKTEVTEKDLTPDDKIIISTHYLPYQVVKLDDKWVIRLTNDPFYNTLCRIFEKRKNVVWTGLLKNYDYIDEQQREEFIIQLAKRNMLVIQLSKGCQEKMKNLINNILEPLFHYITFLTDASIIREFDELWNSFKEFNETVAKVISSQISDNTLVFLHDYHHCLTPSYIYSSYKNIKNKKNLSIGMFIHSPFPAHDLFRRFPYREEMLKAMMNCSLIGFHTFDSSRNFLTSCKRLLNIHYESNIKGDLALSFLGRNVVVRVKHVSSEPDIIKQETQSEIFKNLYTEITTKYKDKYRFVSVDNLLFLTGVRHKLEGYRRLLREIGDNYKQNIFIQYLYKDSTFLSEKELELVEDLRKSILTLVDSINKEFGQDVIEVRECYISYQMRLAVLASGNCFVRTSKREAFSLDIYDFLNVKMMLNDLNDMTYILSELSGVTSSLCGAIKVNPFDFHSLQKGFLEAFQVHFDKIPISISTERDLQHVKKNTITEWANSFLKELKNLNDNNDAFYYLGTGLKLNFLLMKISSNFKELNRKHIIEDYSKAKKRLILLDYEGTLPSCALLNSEYNSKGSYPSNKILSVLDDLTKDKRNTIFIVTGREAKLVSDWFSNINDLGLAAEHGFLYRYNSGSNSWEKMLNDFNSQWRVNCLQHLEPYTERCEGSFIEVKEASVVWQYRDCDVELGKAFSKVITLDLESAFRNLNIINGKGYVEVKPKGLSKGAFASFILKKEIKRNRVPDFILAIGDDTSDEEMFKYLDRKKSEIKLYSKNVKIYSVSVGKKPSKAQSYLESPTDVKTLLESFVQVSLRSRISCSTYNLQNLAMFTESTELSSERNIVFPDDLYNTYDITK